MTTSTFGLERWTFRFRQIGGAGVRELRAASMFLVGALLTTAAFAGRAEPSGSVAPDFGADVELAPFVVRGQQLAISIHARSSRDRRYAEKFAEDVVKVVYDGVTEQTGKGLVIVGVKGEPHPITVFRRFQELAEAGQLAPEVAAATTEMTSALDAWRASIEREKSSEHDAGSEGDDLDFDMEEVIGALPVPLEGVSARLYQIAWAERFDDAKLTERLRSLNVEELRSDPFVKFDWVFYLPPRGALDRVLNEFIAQALKKEEMGFFTRAAAKTVLFVAKPFIRRAIEGMRKGVLFMTVVRAQTDYEDEQVSALMNAYVETMIPGAPKKSSGSAHDRAVAAVREAVEGLRSGMPPEAATPEWVDMAELEGLEATVDPEDVDTDS